MTTTADFIREMRELCDGERPEGERFYLPVRVALTEALDRLKRLEKVRVYAIEYINAVRTKTFEVTVLGELEDALCEAEEE